jgi:hypothetical protein
VVPQLPKQVKTAHRDQEHRAWKTLFNGNYLRHCLETVSSYTLPEKVFAGQLNSIGAFFVIFQLPILKTYRIK